MSYFRDVIPSQPNRLNLAVPTYRISMKIQSSSKVLSKAGVSPSVYHTQVDASMLAPTLYFCQF